MKIRFRGQIVEVKSENVEAELREDGIDFYLDPDKTSYFLNGELTDRESIVRFVREQYPDIAGRLLEQIP